MATIPPCIKRLPKIKYSVNESKVVFKIEYKYTIMYTLPKSLKTLIYQHANRFVHKYTIMNTIEYIYVYLFTLL